MTKRKGVALLEYRVWLTEDKRQSADAKVNVARRVVKDGYFLFGRFRLMTFTISDKRDISVHLRGSIRRENWPDPSSEKLAFECLRRILWVVYRKWILRAITFAGWLGGIAYLAIKLIA